MCQSSLLYKEFTDDGLSGINDHSDSVTALSGTEKSTLFYISGFITFKHNFEVEQIHFNEELEFTDLICKGKLKYPSKWLFNFTLFCYAGLEPKCSNRSVSLFILYLADCLFIEETNIQKIVRTTYSYYFINTYLYIFIITYHTCMYLFDTKINAI